MLDYIDDNQIKGELVLIVQGNHENVEIEISDADIEKLVIERLEADFSRKDAVKSVSRELGISKNRVYDIAMKTEH